MNVKFRFAFLFFTLSVCVIILPYCHSYPKKADYHNFLKTEEFKKLSRADQLLKCASCHKQEYDNEKKGPHANAYHMLFEHRAFVNTDKYKCDFYTRRVNRDYENCAGCHAPQNLWQNMLYDSTNNIPRIVGNIIDIAHPLPPSRSGDAERASSVDCFSCHYDGKNMLSLKHVFSADDTIPGKQTMPVLISNNLTCFVCHADVVRTINPEFAIRKTGSARCVNCHQQTDDTGKGTHYYYWKHDPADKVNPRLSMLLNDFSFHITQGKNTGELVWQNNTMPHKISPGPEIIFKCEVMDKDSNLLGSKTIWVNSKKDFDKEMYSQMENHTLFGVYGINVPLNGEPVTYTVPVKNPAKAEIFKVSLIHKAQYWFPDSLGTVTAVKTVALK